MPFLQWALPRLHMRWRGFRKVKRQVWRRVRRRIEELGLEHEREYRAYLEQHPDEWATLDSFCRITISRLRRDRRVFDALAEDTLPDLVELAARRGDSTLRAWSAGCASGEEAYSLRILWELDVAPRFPGVSLDVLGTDVDPAMVGRARAARYPASSLREVPEHWRAAALRETDGDFVVRERFRDGVRFEVADLRTTLPDETFDLVLCRHLVLTYYDEDLQRKSLRRIASRMHGRGALVVGLHEQRPAGDAHFTPGRTRGVLRRVEWPPPP